MTYGDGRNSDRSAERGSQNETVPDGSSDGLNRRKVLKSVGAFGILGAAPSTAAKTPDSVERTELTGAARDQLVASARNNLAAGYALDELSAEIRWEEAEAYKIDTPEHSIDQTLVPVEGFESRLGIASTPADSAAGLEIEDGEYLQAFHGYDNVPNGVGRSRVAEDDTQRRVLQQVYTDERFRGIVRDRRSNHHIRRNEASVTIHEERDVGIAVVPQIPKKNKEGDDIVIVGEVDLNSGEVLEVNNGCWSCMMNC